MRLALLSLLATLDGLLATACDTSCGADRWGPAAACAAVPESEMNFDADDSLELLEGRHAATLAWQPIDPFGAPKTQDVVFDAATSGTCNADFECGYPYTSVQLTLELPELDRKLDFEGTAYLRNGRAEVVARSDRSAADRLADPQAAVRGTDGERRYALQATFRRDRVVGELRVVDTPRCITALLPARPRPCDAAGGREIEWDTRVGGYTLDDALAELQNVGTQTIPSRGGARDTQVELIVTKTQGAACSTPAAGLGPDDVLLTAPVAVHARTADATLDLDLPAVLQATAGPEGLVVEPSWSEFPAIRVRLSGRALANSSQLTAADGGDSARLRELAPMASVEIELATHDEGTSGALTVRPAEYLGGWPEFAWPEEPRAIALSRQEERCSGVAEQPPQFGGGWGAYAD